MSKSLGAVLVFYGALRYVLGLGLRRLFLCLACWMFLCALSPSLGWAMDRGELASFKAVSAENTSAPGTTNTVVEVSPPQLIQALRPLLQQAQPKVDIVSPQAGDVIADDTVLLQLHLDNLQLFQDPTLKLGPHLQVLLDNQPFATVYDLASPLRMEGLRPGTHTVQVLTCTPWNESFKNAGAAAAVTFHVFTKTQLPSEHEDDVQLIHNSPTGTLGAEPLLLDFLLWQAGREAQDIYPSSVQVTINGQSFVTHQGEVLFLQGLRTGKNWIQLDLLDADGHPRAFGAGQSVRLVTLKPDGNDGLSMLVRGEVPLSVAQGTINASNGEDLDRVSTAQDEKPMQPFEKESI